VLVTGTNGKTTTAAMAAHVLHARGRSLVHNVEGANLLSGIASAFAAQGRAPFALLEVDEAIVPRAAAALGTPRVVVLTNLNYSDAPWLAVKSLSAASSMIWHELRLVGNSAYRFDAQIADLEPFLGEAWRAGVNPKTGNPVYERPVVLVIYRDDHKFLLDPLLPRPGGTMAGYEALNIPYMAHIAPTKKW